MRSTGSTAPPTAPPYRQGDQPWRCKAYAAALFIAGIAIATLTPPLCLAIAIINSTILVAYAVRLKRTPPVLGNAAVAYLTASVFLFGGAFAGIEGLVRNLSLAAITFLATIARELLKDAEDVDGGDAAGGARTLPMIVGVRRTGGIFAFACACGAVVVSLLPPSGDWWGLFYLAGIAVVDLVILFGAFRGLQCTTPGCVRESSATSILRMGGMFAALAVFAIAAVI